MMCVCVCEVGSVVSDSVTLWIATHQLLYPWDSTGKITRVGSHFLLQNG